MNDAIKSGVLIDKKHFTNTSIVIALIFGICSIISSVCFGLRPTIRKQRLEKLEKKVHVLLKDLDSFYAIESELLDECSKLNGKNKETLKREMRKRVKDTKNYTLSDYSTPSNLGKELARYDS